MRYRIEVKKSDIIKGKCGHAERCAVARGFLRAGFSFDGNLCGVLDTEVLAVAPDGTPFSRPLPPRVVAWIRRFDESKKSVKPFSFYIED